MAPGAVCPVTAIVIIILPVARVAGHGRTGINSPGVAGVTGHAGVPSRQREGCEGVVKGSLRPASSIVALGAVCPEPATVRAGLLVARVAGRGRPGINSPGVAGATGQAGVAARQREGCERVVNESLRPASRIVALGTVRPELAPVRIILLVAPVAGCGRTDEDIGGMAGITGRAKVPFCQWERGLVMVKVHLLPIAGIMALSAVFSRALVLVVLLMTGEAIRGGATVKIVDMAIDACSTGMAPSEGIICLVMVNDRLLPVICVVARSAVFASAACVLVVLLVAGIAVLWGIFQLGNGLRALMTVRTGQWCMLSLQWEGHLIMIELLAVGVNAVMTLEAALAERV